MSAAYEKRAFAQKILESLDAQHQIATWETSYPHRYTEEYKALVIEALMWLRRYDVLPGGIIRRVLRVKPDRYQAWYSTYRDHSGYVPQWAHDALKDWTPGDDVATVVPIDSTQPARLEQKED